jgi:hypothetical protein
VTSGDLLAGAIAELYSADPDEFVGRRTALVSGAREAGQAAAARRIAGLRKPTRSAWVVNQLIRSRPDVVSDLADLGEELRAAQRSLDGEAVRQLSQRRRQLVADLVRRALEVSGQNAPSAALRDEVNATLSAAVADPEVAGQLAAGMLERAVHREGFGVAGPPVLTLVPPPPEDESQVRQPAPRPAGAAAAKGTTARGTTAGRATTQGATTQGATTLDAPAGRATTRGATARGATARGATARGATARRRQTVPKAPAGAEAEAARAESERRRQDALADAERDAAQAARAAAAATTSEQQQEEKVRQLEEQLAQARVRLASVRQEARRARARERSAQQALDRRRTHS